MSTTSKGLMLEQAMHSLLKTEIDADRFWAKKANCKLYTKKGYYSKDRQSDIIFDVSIEIFLPGATSFSTVVLIECKNYTHPVPVDDVEEFFSKVQQVAAANAKAVMASTAAFQSGTLNFAKSKGIGLIRYFDESNFKWHLNRSPSALARSVASDEASEIEAALVDVNFRSIFFDLFFHSSSRATNSLWDFFEDLMGDVPLQSKGRRRITNSRKNSNNQIQFREKNDLEDIGNDLLSELHYTDGEVNLDELCSRESERVNLRLERNVALPTTELTMQTLGRITFSPLVIQIYSQEVTNRGRDRFTLAHELSHHFLNHGQHMVEEVCESSDFVLRRSSFLSGSDIARMEFQANYLAACLLMPRLNLMTDFQNNIRKLEIPNRGFGSLYVDDQPSNVENYYAVTGLLMQKYGVSRIAVKIRLESLGLLRDARTTAGLHHINSFL